MENKHCIFCNNLHDNHWVETETQKGNVCDKCYDIWQLEYALCEYGDHIINYLQSEVVRINNEDWVCFDCAQSIPDPY